MTQSDAARDQWVRFRASLREQLEHTPTDRLRDAWFSCAERTTFYTRDLLPRVAADLKLDIAPELFRVDMALGLPSPTGVVPLVWIESENDLTGITHEVRKLASLSGPLKVLICCCEWDDAPGAWQHGGRKRQCLEEWSAILRSHGQAWPDASVFAIVVGEWNASLRFYATVLDALGNSADDHAVLLDRTVGVPPPSVDDRFIVHVTDQGPMTIADMARRCQTSEARIQSILKWAQTSRNGQERYSIEANDQQINVRSKGSWRREILERDGRPEPQ
jgi:hypothetical protein